MKEKNNSAGIAYLIWASITGYAVEVEKVSITRDDFLSKVTPAIKKIMGCPQISGSFMGSVGGKRGGIARKNALTPERRSEIAKKAAETRWKNKNIYPK